MEHLFILLRLFISFDILICSFVCLFFYNFIIFLDQEKAQQMCLFAHKCTALKINSVKIRLNHQKLKNKALINILFKVQ